MFVVRSFMNGICNLLVSVYDLGNLGKQCFFFSPPSFSSILRMRAFLSLQMFASVWLQTYLISFLNLHLKHLFLRSIHRLILLTPSFAVILFFFFFPFLWGKSVSLHLKTKFTKASGSEANSKNNVQCPKKLVFFFF